MSVEFVFATRPLENHSLLLQEHMLFRWRGIMANMVLCVIPGQGNL